MKSAYTIAEVERQKRVAYKSGIKSALSGILNATCLELFDKQGMTKEQVEQIMTGVRETFNAIDENYLNLNDIRRILKEEYDMEIELT